jgi:hypothetical protein
MNNDMSRVLRAFQAAARVELEVGRAESVSVEAQAGISMNDIT